MKLGFYGGTFDPIHHAHLILAREAVEALELDRLFFIPNTISPHKLHTAPTPPAIRAEMVRAAIEGEPRFALEEAELYRSGTSYAIETILPLREKYGLEAEFYYLIGDDNLPELHTWRRIEELKQLVTFVVIHRHGTLSEKEDFITIPRRIDISSTEIRNRVANGHSIRYLVPEKVHDLITRHQLYRS